MDNGFGLSPAQEDFVARMVASGRYDGPSAVVERALDLMARAEAERAARLVALHSALSEDADDLAAATGDAANMPGETDTWHEKAWSEIERLMAEHLPRLRPTAEDGPLPALAQAAG